MGYITGLDIGGTFTDVSAVSVETGAIYTAKARSTPWDLVEGLVEGLGLVAEQAGLTTEELLADTVKFAHGTTQTSNVIFTWVGAKTGLITTRGFADEILIMRARGRVAGLGLADRRKLRETQKPPQIVPRHLIAEAAERIDHRGRVLTGLTREEATRVVTELLDKGVESIAVSLLWAQENSAHELLIKEIINELAPGMHVSLGHELARVAGEYERASTAVINAFVAPTVEHYLDRLVGRMTDLKLQAPLLVLQASGGVNSAEETVPIKTIESGPAAGMVGVKALMDNVGYDNVIATDVGGTTFKVGLLVNGQWSVTQETIINQYSLLIPMIDLVSIGAGGGSIAWVDDTRLRIGPLSAGGDPGPACYGWGGTQPTVTDADLVLGFLNPDRFLAGRLSLSREKAEAAIKEQVADRLFGGDVVKAAAGIRHIVDSQMGDLVRKATIERGHDPRGFVLVAYGGAGPLHASGYSRGIGVKTILVPQAATGFSAYGAAASDIQHSIHRSVRADLLDDPAALDRAYLDIEEEARALVEKQNVSRSDISSSRWAEMRYERQLHDVRVDAKDAVGEQVSAGLREAFIERYEALYGSSATLPNASPQLLRIGVDVVGAITKPTVHELELEGEDAGAARSGTRQVFWPELMEWAETPIYDGTLLRPGNVFAGAAIIEQPGTTIVVPPGATSTVDRFGNNVIHLAVGGSK
ncbi:hydantoinase/oxoprolinase family protein [Rhizomonospora bruguierae]|uniref:hydantoinase/oxoprolinase family protein n=1 Tax=Rhizomonospora bruguierae TaxID=1581705 RepID=UPI001BCFC47A|nr:hydantoinase/oxoprolinase family protein [Micromonospora sp. NBRC 107566]